MSTESQSISGNCMSAGIGFGMCARRRSRTEPAKWKREGVDHSQQLISCELAAVPAMVSEFNVKVTTYDLHDCQVSLPPQILLHLWSHCSQQVIRIHDNVYKWVDQSQQRSMSTYIAIDQATAPHERTKRKEKKKKLTRIQFLLLIWRVFNIQPHKAFIYLFIFSLSSPTTRPKMLCVDMLYVKHTSSIFQPIAWRAWAADVIKFKSREKRRTQNTDSSRGGIDFSQKINLSLRELHHTDTFTTCELTINRFAKRLDNNNK